MQFQSCSMMTLYLFTYAYCLAMLLPLFFPFLHLLYFAPFLILCFNRCSLMGCLWWALICGLVVDLFSSETRLGTYAINYCLTTLCLYRYRFHFFEDGFSTLPVLSFGFTCIFTLIQVAIFYLIDKPITLTVEWLINDLIFFPTQAAIYSILAFSLPAWVLALMKRRFYLFRLARRRRI
jgi:rod shape-determining protein MreD